VPAGRLCLWLRPAGRVAGDPGIAPTLLHPSGAAS